MAHQKCQPKGFELSEVLRREKNKPHYGERIIREFHGTHQRLDSGWVLGVKSRPEIRKISRERDRVPAKKSPGNGNPQVASNSPARLRGGKEKGGAPEESTNTTTERCQKGLHFDGVEILRPGGREEGSEHMKSQEKKKAGKKEKKTVA